MSLLGGSIHNDKLSLDFIFHTSCLDSAQSSFICNFFSGSCKRILASSCTFWGDIVSFLLWEVSPYDRNIIFDLTILAGLNIKSSFSTGNGSYLARKSPWSWLPKRKDSEMWILPVQKLDSQENQEIWDFQVSQSKCFSPMSYSSTSQSGLPGWRIEASVYSCSLLWMSPILYLDFFLRVQEISLYKFQGGLLAFNPSCLSLKFLLQQLSKFHFPFN